jgi:hypothetical protein
MVRLKLSGRELVIDSRPSDAIALATKNQEPHLRREGGVGGLQRAAAKRGGERGGGGERFQRL